MRSAPSLVAADGDLRADDVRGPVALGQVARETERAAQAAGDGATLRATEEPRARGGLREQEAHDVEGMRGRVVRREDRNPRLDLISHRRNVNELRLEAGAPVGERGLESLRAEVVLDGVASADLLAQLSADVVALGLAEPTAGDLAGLAPGESLELREPVAPPGGDLVVGPAEIAGLRRVGRADVEHLGSSEEIRGVGLSFGLPRREAPVRLRWAVDDLYQVGVHHPGRVRERRLVMVVAPAHDQAGKLAIVRAPGQRLARLGRGVVQRRAADERIAPLVGLGGVALVELDEDLGVAPQPCDRRARQQP